MAALRLKGPAEALRLTGPAPAPRLKGPAEPTADNTADEDLEQLDRVTTFVPSYDWQTLDDSVAHVPPGLDVELPLDGKPRRARIPPRWQLKVHIEDFGYWRHEGTRRSTTALALRKAAAEAVGWPAARLMLGGEPVADHCTVEELDLFSRVGDLAVVWASDVGLLLECGWSSDKYMDADEPSSKPSSKPSSSAAPPPAPSQQPRAAATEGGRVRPAARKQKEKPGPPKVTTRAMAKGGSTRPNNKRGR